MPRLQTRRTLLLVDDDVSLRMLLTMVLDRCGYSVRVAHDGFSALRALRESIPETILSDLHMPGMSGFELLSVVRRRFPQIRTIAMSAGSDGHAVPEGLAADAFYAKSCAIDELVALLEQTPIARQGACQFLDAAADPVWIPRSSHDQRGKTVLTVPCPECLRTFPAGCDEFSFAIQEAECHFCGARVRFAIVQPEGMPFYAHALQDKATAVVTSA